MQRWEHLVITLPNDKDADWDGVRGLLDRYGAEGWELVAYQFRPLADIRGGRGLGDVLMGAGAKVDTFQIDSFAIFKRPIAG